MTLSIKKIKTGFHAGQYKMSCSERGVSFGTLVHKNTSSTDLLETYRILKKQVDFSLFLLSA